MRNYDQALFKQLLTYPAETIGIFDMVLADRIAMEGMDLPFIQVGTSIVPSIISACGTLSCAHVFIVSCVGPDVQLALEGRAVKVDA